MADDDQTNDVAPAPDPTEPDAPTPEVDTGGGGDGSGTASDDQGSGNESTQDAPIDPPVDPAGWQHSQYGTGIWRQIDVPDPDNPDSVIHIVEGRGDDVPQWVQGTVDPSNPPDGWWNAGDLTYDQVSSIDWPAVVPEGQIVWATYPDGQIWVFDHTTDPGKFNVQGDRPRGTGPA